MSYAIESKKRKWDRLLESFSDRSSPSDPPIVTPPNPSTVSIVPTFEEELAKKRRLDVSSNISLAKNASAASLIFNYLPSNRTAFLARLETFRSVTNWHTPSTEPINAAEWAKRGWTCADTDTVACGVCSERVLVQVDLADETDKENKSQELEATATNEDDEDSYSAAVELYDAVVKRFKEMIVTAHSDSCPWRQRGCDSSIQRIEGLLNTGNAIAGLKTRYEGLASGDIKVPDTQPLELGNADCEDEIRRFRFDKTGTPDTNALRLAICGWQVKDVDVVECRHCFRSLGLWLYRGEQPAMDRLDAVESHLEYCPWRAASAQHGEIGTPVRTDDLGPRMDSVAGWVLSCHAIIANNAKGGRAGKGPGDDPGRTSIGSRNPSSTNTVVAEPSPEQREKRMKALMKRISAVKKPFNVKSLLNKKKKEEGKA